MPLHVKIVTQEGMLFEDDAADMVDIPGSEGVMGILPHHAALLTTLAYGELLVKKGEAQESFIVFGGIAEVGPDHVTVLAETAESSYAVDEAQAQQARQRAEQLMQSGVPQDKTYALEELRRAGIQENILQKIKQRPPTVRIKIVEDKPEEN
jgi:F-type H+-transporting ATPase subunit epsilon